MNVYYAKNDIRIVTFNHKNQFSSIENSPKTYARGAALKELKGIDSKVYCVVYFMNPY